MRPLILLSFFILPACLSCEDSFRINLDNLVHFGLENSQESLPIIKEPISESDINRAERSVWEINNYLVFMESQIHILEENKVPKYAQLEQKEQKIHLGHGSGFFISPTQMITNFHVIHNINKNTQIMANKELENGEIESRTMTLVKVSAFYDLALLSTETPSTNYVEVKLPNIEPKRDSFFLIGYPNKRFINIPINYQESLWSQIILSFYRDTQLGDLQGASGGPIIDQNGNVAGVNHAGTDDSILAVSNTALKDFLTNNHTDCSILSEEENCIHNELNKLAKMADQGDTFAQYKFQFNNNYNNLFKKRIAFQKLITEIRKLNHIKFQLINSANDYIKRPTEEHFNQYRQNSEDYRQQSQIYNQAVEELSQIQL